MNLLSMNGMTKIHTDRKLFDQADFSLSEGEKIGIIGINGTGKTTLLRILEGSEELDEGTYTKGNHVVVKGLSQNPELPKGTTIYDYVIQENKTEDNMWSLEGDAKNILTQLGFSSYEMLVDHLSGGEKKRVALAAALLTSCDILILDEPTNHLDSEMSDWLEGYLKARRGALIMVTHDRYFLEQVCSRIVEIDKGNLYSYEGNYEKYLELKAQREEMEVATERKNQSLYRMELEWMKRGARARSTKQKARIERFEELKERKKPVYDENVAMSSIGSRMGKKTVELHGISKAFEHKKLLEEFEYIFLRNDRVGIVGHNGCGKSTLLNMITGNIEPDTGYIEYGETIKIGYFSQENEYMDETLKVIDYIREVGEYIETAEGSITAAKLLERFLFDGTMQYQVIGKLSGGEKRRLYLLRILMSAPNVLILDEPTNDLDIATLNILETYLDEFQGIVITVSHDRYFLDRTMRRIFAFEEGIITIYEGGFSDYQEQAKEKNAYGKTREFKNPVDVSNGKTNFQSKKQEKVHEKKLKFTFKEQQEFDTIDQDILDLEQEIEDKNEEMGQVVSDFVKLHELQVSIDKLQEQLDYKMERWMILQELYEKINEN